MKVRIIAIAVLFLGFTSQITYAQPLGLEERAGFSEIKTVFQQLEGYQQLILKTDLDSLVLNKYTSLAQEASMIAIGENQPNLAIPIRIEARGAFRRKICDIPPIKLNFSKKNLEEQGLYPNYDKIKMVTYCQLEEGKATEEALLKEY